MKPRILIFSTAYYPLVGGAEVAIKEITDRATNYDFDLVTARLDPNLPAHEVIGRVTVHRLGWGRSFDKYWLAIIGGLWAWRANRQKNYRAIWSIMASYGGLAAFFAKKLIKRPVLLTIQEGDDLDEIRRRTRSFSWLFRKIFTTADHIQCISRFLADWAESFGVSADIYVVPNGVAIERIDEAVRQGGGPLKPNDKVVLITTSRLVKKNGVEDIIRAVARLPEQFILWVVGTGPLENHLRQIAKDLGVADRIFFHGFVSGDAIFSYLAKADIFIRPSLSEGLGNSFLEAMAVGLPTVGTPVGGIVDFLIEDKTGWLVPVQNPRALAEKVNWLADPVNSRSVEKVALAGQELVRTKYCWNDVTDKMIKIFDSLIRQ